MFTLSKWGASLVLVSLLAGCKVGPDFHTPATTMPSAWLPPTTAPTTRQSVATGGPLDVARWWTLFNDDKLNSLIERAVDANIDLKVATSRVRQARASRGITRSALWPTADVSGSYRRTGSGSDSRDIWAAGLDANWEIDIFGGNQRALEASDANIILSIENRRDILVSLLSEVALTYIDLRGAQREIVVANENLAVQRHSADVTRQKLAGGQVGRLDVARADASVATTESQIPQLESRIRRDIYSISVLLGQLPSALVDELSPEGPLPKVPSSIPAGIPSELLRRRPDVRAAEASVHAATANIGVAESDLFPRFSLTGSFNESAGAPRKLWRWDNGIWSIGPSVSWNIFDAGRIRSNIDVQKAAQEQTLLNYQQTVLTALQDVENALIAYEKEQQFRTSLAVAVDSNRRAYDIANVLYANGQTDFLSVLDAQRSLFLSDDALTQSDERIATNLVSLYKALGGGWDETEGQNQNGPTTQP